MKGTLIKTEQGWMVEYLQVYTNDNIYGRLPLHPNDILDIEQHIEATKITHGVEPILEAYFNVIKRYTDSHNNQVQLYAKLTIPPVESNETMIGKQTATEWLFKILWDEPKDKLNWHAILNTAIEMERQQIIDCCMDFSQNFNEGDAIKYYNETYGKP
jgi:hypothetical protein